MALITVTVSYGGVIDLVPVIIYDFTIAGTHDNVLKSPRDEDME